MTTPLLPTRSKRSAGIVALFHGSALVRFVAFALIAAAAVVTLTRPRQHRSISSAASSTAAGVETVRLRSGLEMPSVGFGTCCRPSAKGEAIYQSTVLYLQHGGRHIDTAMAYGNHDQVGRAVADSGVPRSEIWITSKIAPNKVKGYDETLVAVDGILNDLQTTHLDLLLIHAPKLGKDKTIELWRGLMEAKRLGKVHSIGVSNFNRHEINDIAEATGGEMPEVNEIQFHPWSPPEWKALAEWGKRNGVTTVAYTSLGGSRFHRSSSGGPDWPSVVTDTAHRYGATEAQVLLRWALRQGVVVIPGATSEKHIFENLHIPEFDMTDDEASVIEGSDHPKAWWDPKRGPFKLDSEAAETAWAESKKHRA